MTPDTVTLNVTSEEVEYLWRTVSLARIECQANITKYEELAKKPETKDHWTVNKTLVSLRFRIKVLNMLHSKLERASRPFRTV